MHSDASHLHKQRKQSFEHLAKHPNIVPKSILHIEILYKNANKARFYHQYYDFYLAHSFCHDDASMSHCKVFCLVIFYLITIWLLEELTNKTICRQNNYIFGCFSLQKIIFVL